MKKFLLSCAVFLGLVGGAHAQQLVYQGQVFDVLPKWMASDNKAKYIAGSLMDAKASFTIYDENFNIEKEITFTHPQQNLQEIHITYGRKQVFYNLEVEGTGDTQMVIPKEYIEVWEIDSTYIDSYGQTIYVPVKMSAEYDSNENEYDSEGKPRYSFQIYDIGDDSMYGFISYYYRSEKYSGEWEIIGEYNHLYSDYFDEYADIYNYDMDVYSEGQIITQGVFNNDDKYEIVRYNYEEFTDTLDMADRDGDGEIDKYILRTGYKVVGCDIVQEDGTILFSLPDINDVFVANGETYVRDEEWYDWGYTVSVYKLNNETGAVQQVANTASAMKVFPTLASTSDVVTVETAASDDVRRLVITNMAGQVVSV